MILTRHISIVIAILDLSYRDQPPQTHKLTTCNNIMYCQPLRDLTRTILTIM